MDHICLALPIVTGQTAAARTFLQQLDTTRRAEFDQSERRIGITKELWHLAKLPSGDHLVGYMESQNFGHALASFVGSREPFDVWFKEQMPRRQRRRPEQPAGRHGPRRTAVALRGAKPRRCERIEAGRDPSRRLGAEGD